MIDNLQGTFLSNFYDCKIDWWAHGLRNAESAYQMIKCANIDDYEKFQNISGAQAKALGKQIQMRTDWNDIKLKVMKCNFYLSF